jgi:two-component system chemotaxis response regulator CheB
LKKRVLVVGDSVLVRRILGAQISKYPYFTVVGNAVDPYDAREKIFRLRPDILTLDLEMPRMDGLLFLSKLMKYHPVPVVVVSSQAQEGSSSAMSALDLGAVEVVPKPSSQFTVADMAHALLHALRAAASGTMEKLQSRSVSQNPETSAHEMRLSKTTHYVVAIGASTGGTRAIEAIMRKMPADAPGTIIVQHMPQSFTGAFAERLNRLCSMQVREARDHDEVTAGVALIAPGDKHMVLSKNGMRYQVRLKDGPRIHFQRPSVDVLFQSVALNSGQNAIGVILTGMGSDGAKGLLAMRSRGAHTIAQDAHSCVIFGMPKEAIELGGVDEVLPLLRIAGAILNRVRSSPN